MNEWLKQKTNIEKKVQQKLSYPYLRKFIEKPEIDDTRLLILMLPFTMEQLSAVDMKKYITTATLIQIALDTHENVTALSRNIAKDQQLTVLAGDYFSGLYYQILAELKDIQMIRSLSGAVKSINENKIALYQQEHVSIDSVMESVFKIETEIVERFFTTFHFQSFFPAVSQLLFVKRLLKEKEYFLSGKKALVAEAIKSLQFPKGNGQLSNDEQHEIIQICDHYIDHARLKAENALEGQLSAHHAWRLYSLLYNAIFGNKIYAGEG
ncbi:heptaprenyl diphosphate synthase [Bacillus aerolatus]|uniref:Heptaprenyl diphosphate synthase n=1 Tax=Bacillus aerolatus TaxID=2653354 RepID=A0A6I1FZS8_9BACI|nr:heptaprenyl diphosphate synthase component 1 [Bacillus aerolatus]KAB7708906.1 heptaprenyl diphosphate synthase [Bacillus aerolatus]